MFNKAKQLLINASIRQFERNNSITDHVLDFISQRRDIAQRKLIPNTKGDAGDHAFQLSDLSIPGSEVVLNLVLDDPSCVEKMPSLAGYVPYLKNQTTIVLYNFISKNYGIRKQLLGRITLCEKSSFKETKWFLLPADGIANLDCKELFNLDGDYLIVELFHPKIPHNHGGHGGQLRYWGVYGDHNATVHSQPIEPVALLKPAMIAFRRHLPEKIKRAVDPLKVTITSRFGTKKLNKNVVGDFSSIPSNYQGFVSVQEVNDNNKTITRALWHDAKYERASHDSTYIAQLISLPKIPNLDAIAYFGEAITRREKVLVHFKDELNQTLQSIETEVEPSSEIKLSELAGQDLSAYSFVALEFVQGIQSSVFRYVNFFYVNEGKLCDNVHCHTAANSQFVSLNKKFGAQCLKFMHFPSIEDYQSILSVWGVDKDVKIKIRFLLQNRQEFIIHQELKKWVVNHFDLAEIFEQYSIPKDRLGVAQLECYNANPNATLVTFNRNDLTVSVDHLTGG